MNTSETSKRYNHSFCLLRGNEQFKGNRTLYATFDNLCKKAVISYNFGNGHTSPTREKLATVSFQNGKFEYKIYKTAKLHDLSIPSPRRDLLNNFINSTSEFYKFCKNRFENEFLLRLKKIELT